MNSYVVSYRDTDGTDNLKEFPATNIGHQAMLNWIADHVYMEFKSVKLVKVIETYQINFGATLSKK